MNYIVNESEITFEFESRIDTSNSDILLSSIEKILQNNTNVSLVIFDFEKVSYLSSSGLRMILSIKKEFNNLKIINVQLEVYEILEVTSFVDIIDIQKRYREISIEGCELIGEGCEGLVYKLNPDTIVKVFKFDISYENLQREIGVSKKAFVLGIPTAIAYDIVKVNGKFGLVFELINGKSFCKQLIKDITKIDQCIDYMVDLIKSLHSIKVREGTFPNGNQIFLNNVVYIKRFLSDEQFSKLYLLASNLKTKDCLIHGDCHIKNILVQNDKPLLIDLESISIGDPILEYAPIYISYVLYQETDENNGMDFFGIDSKYLTKIYYSIIDKIFGNRPDKQDILNKITIAGVVFILVNIINYNQLNEVDRINNALKHLDELLPLYDNLDINE